MKKLYLIRHAKSSWKNLTLEDFDRPLSKRGKKNAPFMGNLLKQLEIKPDLIICSPAYRTRVTAELIALEINYEKHKIEYYENLYEASLEDIEESIKYLEDKYEIVFLVGHNPSLNQFSEKFGSFKDNIPTCGIIELNFNCQNWQNISSKNCHLISFEFPKKYKY